MNNLHKKCLALIAAVIMGAILFAAPSGFAAENKDNIDALIQDQQQILDRLNERKVKQQEDTLNRVKLMEEQMNVLQKRYSNYDAEGAVTALAAQISSLQEQIAAQQASQDKILQELKKLKEEQNTLPRLRDEDDGFYGVAATKMFLVNPGPARQTSFTQDAINAQGNSTMVFSYAPNQLYKVYCRVGYLTDLAFKSGEKITFVGGGDTSAWMIDSTEVNDVPHLYIKPIQADSTTNIIVNTTKHSYQIIAKASDWYNPMVRWSYSSEEQLAQKLQAREDEKIYTGSLQVSSPEQLNFSYEIKGKKSWKPSMVFDDGKKTYIQFEHMSNNMPILFIKESNRKEVSLVNYRIKGKYYIVDKIFREAQLRLNDKDTIKIIAKK